MKKTYILFVIWGVLVVIVVGLLTYLGFNLKSKFKDYEKLEEKLLDSAKKYVDTNFLYPEGKQTLKVTSTELIEKDFLDELRFKNDVCTGYVKVYNDNVYKYDVFIKCNNYTTKGYQK